eukprot:jgi/Mesvir1/12204/Mv26383-RA.1
MHPKVRLPLPQHRVRQRALITRHLPRYLLASLGPKLGHLESVNLRTICLMTSYPGHLESVNRQTIMSYLGHLKGVNRQTILLMMSYLGHLKGVNRQTILLLLSYVPGPPQGRQPADNPADDVIPGPPQGRQPPQNFAAADNLRRQPADNLSDVVRSPTSSTGSHLASAQETDNSTRPNHGKKSAQKPKQAREYIWLPDSKGKVFHRYWECTAVGNMRRNPTVSANPPAGCMAAV